MSIPTSTIHIDIYLKSWYTLQCHIAQVDLIAHNRNKFMYRRDIYDTHTHNKMHSIMISFSFHFASCFSIPFPIGYNVLSSYSLLFFLSPPLSLSAFYVSVSARMCVVVCGRQSWSWSWSWSAVCYRETMFQCLSLLTRLRSACIGTVSIFFFIGVTFKVAFA